MRASVCSPLLQAFISGLQQTFSAMEKDMGDAVSVFHRQLPAALTAAAVPAAAIAGVEAAQCGPVGALQATVADMKEAANKQQREISRLLEPLVQEHMMPGCALPPLARMLRMRRCHASTDASNALQMDICSCQRMSQLAVCARQHL